jgi:hypothetical protein
MPPEKIIDYVNQLYEISKLESIPVQEVPNHIRQKLEEKGKIDQEIKEADAVLQSKNVSIEIINQHIQLNAELGKLGKHGLSTDNIDKLLNLLINGKEYGFEANKVVGKLRNIKRLEKREDKLKSSCEILSKQLQEYKEILPLAQKILAMNIDISELLALDTAVNQTAKQYNIPLSTAAFRVFRDIRDYNKIGGLKKQLSGLCQHIFVINGLCANQNQAITALVKMQSQGITEEQILYMNNFLENKRYNIDMKSSS